MHVEVEGAHNLRLGLDAACCIVGGRPAVRDRAISAKLKQATSYNFCVCSMKLWANVLDRIDAGGGLCRVVGGPTAVRRWHQKPLG